MVLSRIIHPEDELLICISSVVVVLRAYRWVRLGVFLVMMMMHACDSVFVSVAVDLSTPAVLCQDRSDAAEFSASQADRWPVTKIDILYNIDIIT